MEFDLKWVHMARYELILKLDGAIWLRIIFRTLLIPPPKGCERSKQIKNNPKEMLKLSRLQYDT